MLRSERTRTRRSVKAPACPYTETVASSRLTLIGLDAATLDVIDPLIASGGLPNLARVFGAGAHGVLRSTTHPITPHAWTTLVTGVNAARHGIWDFIERSEDGYELRLVNGSHRRAPAIWDRLVASGRRAGLVNVPFTWPAPELDGFVISGFDAATRDEGMTFPASLIGEMRARFGELALDHRFPLDESGQLDLDDVRRSVEQKVELAVWLCERFDPELFFVVFMSADHIHHLCWTDWDADGVESPVASVYRILDEAVGALVEGVTGGDDVMIVSDHGGGGLEGVVNLNAWLAQEGFLGYAERRPSLRHRVMSRRRMLPESLRRLLKQAAPTLSDRASRVTASALIDWSSTQAFAYGTFGNVVVNVRGREREGTVAPGAEYDRVRDEIAERLLELRGPGGEQVVAAVHRRESLFDGPELEKVPDLLVEFDRYAWLGKGNLKRRTDTIWDEIEIEGSAHAYVGSHRHEGLIALAGPSVAAGVTLSAAIEDVAPTALYLLGESIPADLEGRVLFEAVDPALLDRRPPEYDDTAGQVVLARSESYSASEAREVEDRLRGLGYLE